MRLYFCILHYKRAEITSRCIDSLLNLPILDNVEVSIVVIDNASNNGSLEALKAEYSSCENIEWILSSENVGFAKGNNIAFDYVKRQGDADLAVFLNNDTEVVQGSFVEVLMEEYLGRAFDVLSVDVHDPYADQHQSPLCEGAKISEYSSSEAERVVRVLDSSAVQIAVIQLKVVLAKLFGRLPWFQTIVERRVRGCSLSSEWENARGDIVPNGACVIFSRRYIDDAQFAFYPGTHMYFEECILKLYCDKKGFSVWYTPSLQVLHHHHEFGDSFIRKSSWKALKGKAEEELASYQTLKPMIENGLPDCL